MESSLDFPTTPWPRRMQRVVDLAVGSLLLVISAPVVLLVALAIRLESPGPVLVVRPATGVQRRRPRPTPSSKAAGRRVHDAGGALFGQLGFRVRTTTASVLGEPAGTLTRLGTWLRASGFEHWPQLLHVLSGELTLVGPRALSPRWAVRLNEEVPLYAEVMVGVVPGWTGLSQARHSTSRRGSGREGAAGAHDPLLATLVERVLHDLPYALAWRRCSGVWQALCLNACTLRSCLWQRAPGKASSSNEVVVLEHALIFEQLPLDAHDLAERRPLDMAADVHEHDGLVTTWWYPPRRAVVRHVGHGARSNQIFSEAWCDGQHAYDPAELVLTKQLQSAPGGTDVIQVVLPCTLQGLGAVCEHLMPLWEALQWRCQEQHLGIKQTLVVLEGASQLAAREGAPDDRITITLEIDTEAARVRMVRKPQAGTAGPGLPGQDPAPTGRDTAPTSAIETGALA